MFWFQLVNFAFWRDNHDTRRVRSENSSALYYLNLRVPQHTCNSIPIGSDNSDSSDRRTLCRDVRDLPSYPKRLRARRLLQEKYCSYRLHDYHCPNNSNCHYLDIVPPTFVVVSTSTKVITIMSLCGFF